MLECQHTLGKPSPSKWREELNGHESSTVANIFSSNMCKACFSTKKPEESQHLVPDSFDCIYSTGKKCFQTNQDNLQTQAFKSIQGWKMDRFAPFFSFSFEDCWMLYVFFTKIQSFTRASDFCSYETFKDALRGNGDHPTDKANECLPLRRTWTPLHWVFNFQNSNVSPGTLVMLAIEAMQEYICSPIWRTDWWAKTNAIQKGL